jgi:hypothetical protein
VRHYIERRLWIAHGGPHSVLHGRHEGARGLPNGSFWRVRFTPTGVRAVSAVSGGVPRIVNVLCDRALELGWQRRNGLIGGREVLEAARQLRIRLRPLPRLTRFRRDAVAAGLVGAAGIAIAYLVAGGVSSGGSPSPSTTAGPRPVPVSSSQAAEPAVAPLPETRGFLVVVGSFRTTGAARALESSLAASGLPAFTQVTDGWRQVVVGPYLSLDEARDAQHQLQALRVRDAYISPTVPSRNSNASWVAPRS